MNDISQKNPSFITRILPRLRKIRNVTAAELAYGLGLPLGVYLRKEVGVTPLTTEECFETSELLKFNFEIAYHDHLIELKKTEKPITTLTWKDCLKIPPRFLVNPEIEMRQLYPLWSQLRSLDESAKEIEIEPLAFRFLGLKVNRTVMALLENQLKIKGQVLD